MSALITSVVIRAVDQITRPGRKISESMGRMAQQFTKSSQKAQTLGQSTQNLQGKIKRVVSSIRESCKRLVQQIHAGERLKKVYQSLNNVLGSHVARLNKINQLQQRIQTTSDKLQANANRRAELRGQLIDTIALGYAFSKPIQAAMDFEDAMTDVTKNVANADFDTMRTAINEIAKVSPLGATGVAKLVSEAGKIGFGAKQALEFSKVSEQMAVAFELSTNEAGSYITKFVSSMGLGLGKIGELGDAINYLGDNTTSNAKNITQITSRFGSLGLKAGFSKEQTAALAAAMDGVSPNAESAGTAMKNLLSALSQGEKASKPTREALESLGFTASEVAQNMQEDAAGTIRDVLAAIGDAPDELQLSLLKVIVGDEALGAAGALVNNLKSYDKAMSLVASRKKYLGSVTDEYARKSATAKFQMAVMRSNLSILAESIGRTLLPTLNALMQNIAKVASTIADLSERFPVVTKAVIGLTTALVTGKIAMIAFGYAASFIQGALLTSKLGFLRTQKAITTFNASVTRSTTAILPAFAKGIRSTFRSMRKHPFKTMFAGLKHLTKGLLLPLKPLALLTKGLLSVSVAMLTTPFGLIVTAVAATAYTIYKYWDRVKAFISGVVEGFKSAAAPIQESLKPIQPVLEKIGDVIGWVTEKVSAFLTPITATKEELKSATEAGRQFGEAVANAIHSVIKVVSRVSDFFGSFFGENEKELDLNVSKSITQVVKQIPEPNISGKMQLRPKEAPTTVQPIRTQGTTITNHHQSDIIINQLPGENAEKLARRIIQEEIRIAKRKEQVENRAALFDVN
ncbi:phage tail tape measure protein [Algicola sagamiensis]|uniref:phage tail tape measure protein n=1 Tax=Algicola sagamiensis TaxID=163869 RepID=UPI00036738C7|nr:phage tail tape measure protein [Algicola sagamiensis]